MIRTKHGTIIAEIIKVVYFNGKDGIAFLDCVIRNGRVLHQVMPNVLVEDREGEIRRAVEGVKK